MLGRRLLLLSLSLFFFPLSLSFGTEVPQVFEQWVSSTPTNAPPEESKGVGVGFPFQVLFL